MDNRGGLYSEVTVWDRYEDSIEDTLKLWVVYCATVVYCAFHFCCPGKEKWLVIVLYTLVVDLCILAYISHTLPAWTTEQ